MEKGELVLRAFLSKLNFFQYTLHVFLLNLSGFL